MPTSIEDAMDRLAAADPAAGLADEAWAGAPTSVAEPRRSLLPALAAAACVAALAIGIAVATNRDRPGTPPSDPGTSGPVDRRAQAQAFVDDLVARAPVLPEAAEVGAAPPVTFVGQTLTLRVLAVAQRWWTAPGSVTEADAYLQTRLPGGLALGSTQYVTEHGEHVGEAFTYNPSAPSPDFVSTTLELSIVEFDGGVAVQAMARVYQEPKPPPRADDTFIRGATEVDITVRRRGIEPDAEQYERSKTLDGVAATELADVVNALPSALPERHSCPVLAAWNDDTLVFHTLGGEFRVVVQLWCSLTITTPTERSVGLGGELDTAVLDAMGLPRDYGR